MGCFCMPKGVPGKTYSGQFKIEVIETMRAEHYFIFHQNIKRRVCAITGKGDELRGYIVNDLHSGATIYHVTGACTMEPTMRS